MNREIEFRGQCVLNGEWLYGDLEYSRKDKDIVRIHTYNDDGSYKQQCLVVPDTVGQFTGLRDKNGVKVFEGDIVHMVWQDLMSSRWHEKTRSVEFKWGRFTVFHLKPYEHSDKHYFEVIGNIYDNPELFNENKERIC